MSQASISEILIFELFLKILIYTFDNLEIGIERNILLGKIQVSVIHIFFHAWLVHPV